jgi:hypothetical protein
MISASAGNSLSVGSSNCEMRILEYKTSLPW